MYIVHQSGLFKFVAEKALAGTSAADMEKLSLQDLVDDAELKNWVSNIVYVSEQASVGDAKRPMESQKGCQDLIVTKTGSKTEPMLGWMTNVDVGRLSKACRTARASLASLHRKSSSYELAQLLTQGFQVRVLAEEPIGSVG